MNKEERIKQIQREHRKRIDPGYSLSNIHGEIENDDDDEIVDLPKMQPDVKLITICDLYAKVIVEIDQSKFPLKSDEGQYPRIGWIHSDGRKVTRNDVKFKIILIKDSPHYKFVSDDEEPYKKYMNISGWVSGHGKNRGLNATKNFENLIKNLNYLKIRKYENQCIECVMEKSKYVIVDGLHRASILSHKLDNDDKIRVRIIKCLGFMNLPIIR